jgi:hypothetical protein
MAHPKYENMGTMALHSSCLLLGSFPWGNRQKTVQVWDTSE